MGNKRWLILIAVLYITFIGGTAYTANNIILRIFYHVTSTTVIGVWLIRRPSLPRTPLDIFFALYALWLGITTLTSQNSRVSLEQMWAFLIYIFWFYILISLMREGHQRAVFEVLFLAAGVLIIVSLAEFSSWYFGLGFAGFNQGWFSIGGLTNPIPPEWHKLALAMNVSTILGNYVILLLPVVMAWGLSTKKIDYTIGFGMIAIGLALVLFGTGSRGSWGAVVPAIGVLAGFQLLRHEKLKSFIPSKLIILAMISGVVIIAAGIFLFTFQSSNTSDIRRVDMWESAVEIAQDNPITGVGTYQFGTEFRFIRDTSLIQDKLVSAHNLWLNTLAELGIIGLVLLIGVQITFFLLWIRVWSNTESIPQKIRLEGILAALIGYFVHSLIDAFNLGATVLVIMIYVAYVVSRANLPTVKIPALYRWGRYPITAILAIYFIWLIRVDVAELRFLFGLADIVDENYTEALDRIERAQSLDNLSVYDLQYANVLGILADENPDEYLDSAIDHHLSSLEENLTFDIGFANLATLYAQQGNYEQAIIHMTTAADIHPDIWQYWLKLGEYQEELGLEDEAINSYINALELNLEITASAFWDTSTIKQAALATAYESFKPAKQTLLAIYRNWPERAADSVSEIDIYSEIQGYWAIARYEVYAGNLENALSAYDTAIDQSRIASKAELYAERAEVQLQLGNLELAEEDARTAIFLQPIEGSGGYYILAQLALMDDSADDEILNDWLAQAVTPRVVFHEYGGAVYGRLAFLDYLPQMQVAGQGQQAYEPWFLLAERYATDDDPDTDPDEVYEAILKDEPYITLPGNP